MIESKVTGVLDELAGGSDMLTGLGFAPLAQDVL
jgi:hypothetical protein